jgi:CHAT domain-containing protein/tetratricopeptide (TPR) repeat protein
VPRGRLLYEPPFKGESPPRSSATTKLEKLAIITVPGNHENQQLFRTDAATGIKLHKGMYVKKLKDLIGRVKQLSASGGHWEESYNAAEELWEYPSYEEEIKDNHTRDKYIIALFIVADLFPPEDALAVLKRVYTLDSGHAEVAVKGSAKELAAYRLGALYEKLGSYHSAVLWYRRCLDLAQTTGVRGNTLLNLGALGRTFEFLALYEAAGQYYDQVLQMLSNVPPGEQDAVFLIPAAMYHILHGDQARGEAVLRLWMGTNLKEPRVYQVRREPLEPWAYEALHYFGMHYIATGRPQEAIQLAERMKLYKPNFVDDKIDLRHALIAKAFLQLGHLDRALEELAKVHDVDMPQFSTEKFGEVHILELWIDIARVHAAKHNYEKAIAAYVVLAYSFGALTADPSKAPSIRLRFYWLQQMAFVVHEMVSVWLTITDVPVRQRCEATVGNALLQLKGNLFVALAFHRGPFGSVKFELFTAARKYAAAARKAVSRPDDPEALLDLEEALRERENVEASLMTAEINPSPAFSAIFSRDFRTSYILAEETLVLDYSLVNYQPPRNGLAGSSQGLRYIGVRLTAGSLQVIDLGDAEQIEMLCGPLIQALSTPPMADEDGKGGPENRRQLRPADWNQRRKEAIDHDDFAKRVYQRVVAPFEPLPRSLSFSADGMLAALPFHALTREDRYLVEDRDVVYCYSLLERETQYYRQLSSTTAVRPPITRSALLLGDPIYTANNLVPLPGTKIEIEEVAKLLRTRELKDDNSLFFDKVLVKTGAHATVSQLHTVYQPLILHIAAHGAVDQRQTQLYTSRPLTFGGYYRRSQQTRGSAFNELDNALLHSIVMLAEDSAAIGDPANGTLLTALELASLNLFHGVVVISACETGAGMAENGAGVLGFQYAVVASGAQAGLLSLWKILDQETSNFMIDFYRYQLDRHSAKAAYLSAVRKHCRRGGHRVHPYYWAAFMFLDHKY